MPTIAIWTWADPSGPPHIHIEEDISSQIDGYKYIFSVSQVYIPGSITVLYNGVTYTKENDFVESGPSEFTFSSGDPFPPELDCPLVAIYRRIPN